MRRLSDWLHIRQPLAPEDNMEQWDGKERRVGEGDRRKAQRVPFHEYPKMIDGSIVHSAAHEKAVTPKPEKAERTVRTHK